MQPEQSLSERATTVFFSPNPGTYAVIRMNPVAMVKDLNDPEALSAAEAIQPKAYVVYLKNVRDFREISSNTNLVMLRLTQELEIPFPNKPWYRYKICPIAPSLRAEDKDEGYAADMCIPIFPNTSHPRGRTPLRTEPVFPYSSCYHWAEFETNIRVRARPERFDERRAIMLKGPEKVKMNRYWGEDITRMDELQAQYRAATGWQDPAVQVSVDILSHGD